MPHKNVPPETFRLTAWTLAIAWSVAMVWHVLGWGLLLLTTNADLLADATDSTLSVLVALWIWLKISHFAPAVLIGAWIGYRLPRRGWIWGICAGVLILASLCALGVFTQLIADTMTAVRKIGAGDLVHTMLFGVCAYAGQCWRARAQQPLFVRPWHHWEWDTWMGSGSLTVLILASSLLPLRWDTYRLTRSNSTTNSDTAELIDSLPQTSTAYATPSSQELHHWAQKGDLEAIRRLMHNPNDAEKAELALIWFLVAKDYGHIQAQQEIDDLLEVTVLRYDDDGFALGQAHYALLLAYLRGDHGLTPDTQKAAAHAELICAVFNTNQDIPSDAQSLPPEKRALFQRFVKDAHRKC
jgi:hypothetical protein